MSFNSSGPFNFGPFDDPKPPPTPKPEFWKILLLACVPPFIASVIPPITMHFLQKNERKNAENKRIEEQELTEKKTTTEKDPVKE